MGDIKKFIQDNLGKQQQTNKDTQNVYSDNAVEINATVIHAQNVYVGASQESAERSKTQTERFRTLVKDIRTLQEHQGEPLDRERCYRVCHGIAKEYQLYAEMRTLMHVRWRCQSMRDLGDQALHQTLIFMRALEYLQRAIPHIAPSPKR